MKILSLLNTRTIIHRPFFLLLYLIAAPATIASENITSVEEQLDSQFDEFNVSVHALLNTNEKCDSDFVTMSAIPKELLSLKNNPSALLKTSSEEANYSNFLDFIERWSLHSVDDYRDYKVYLQSIEKLVTALASYYVERFQVAQEHAFEIAHEGIYEVLAKTINNAEYQLYRTQFLANQEQFELRKLILEKGDINTIRQFKDKAKILEIPREPKLPQHFESILAIAVDYPKALAHLLSIGISPNHSNGFGKTPLMYAVQKNQFKSVKLLLEHGASVNETTKNGRHFRINECQYYQLNQYHVSALHYAARFASTEIIKLLIDYGANKSVINRSRDLESIPSGTPYEWLQHFRPGFDQEAEQALFFEFDPIALKHIKKRLQSLRASVAKVSNSSGHCGSANTHVGWNFELDKQFDELILHPDNIEANSRTSGNSSFDSDVKNMALWSLQGIAEYERFKAFKQDIRSVTRDLAQFYKTQYRIPEALSLQRAQQSIETTISSGFRFSTQYTPFGSEQEIRLRQAILSKAPLAVVKGIDLSQVQKVHPGEHKDSVLNVAINYPEALSHLLATGFDINASNGFGKTPLMYAAQNNALDAARLLLEAGAEVNATTFIPKDDCNYTLKTSSITALHYAVRYGNKALIELLLHYGAKTYMATTELWSAANKGYPIDWLNRFENLKLSPEDHRVVAKLLRLPGSESLRNISKRHNIKGEEHYSIREYKKSKLEFVFATNAQPGNARALNNLAITALKLDQPGLALQSSFQVIKSKITLPQDIAAAWFNAGLACEGTNYLRFESQRYCEKPSLAYYIQSYKAFPSNARHRKILDKMARKDNWQGASCLARHSQFDWFNYSAQGYYFFLSKQDMPQEFANVKYRGLDSDFTAFDRDMLLVREQEIELQGKVKLSVYTHRDMSSVLVFDEGICNRFSHHLIPSNAQLIHIDASDRHGIPKLNLHVDRPYVVILSGAKLWDVSETGKVKSIFILDKGEFLEPTEKLHSSHDFADFMTFQRDERYHYNVIQRLSNDIGVPLQTRFKIKSLNKVTITDADIIRAKLIVSEYPRLNFTGVGDYKVAFTDDEGAFDNISSLANVEKLATPYIEGQPVSGDSGYSDDPPRVPDVYHRVKLPVNTRYGHRKTGFYRGEGFFVK